MTYQLNAVASALAVHPRTILRLTTGQPNPYWAEGYDPEADVPMIAAVVGSSAESIEMLIAELDSALTVEEAAKVLKVKSAEFYRKNLTPDWQVGRVKRYSLTRLATMVT